MTANKARDFTRGQQSIVDYLVRQIRCFPFGLEGAVSEHDSNIVSAMTARAFWLLQRNIAEVQGRIRWDDRISRWVVWREAKED